MQIVLFATGVWGWGVIGDPSGFLWLRFWRLELRFGWSSFGKPWGRPPSEDAWLFG